VCVCVCVYVCFCVCVCVSVSVYVCMCVSVSVSVGMCACVVECVHVCVCDYTVYFPVCAPNRMCISVCVCARTHTQIEYEDLPMSRCCANLPWKGPNTPFESHNASDDAVHTLTRTHTHTQMEKESQDLKEEIWNMKKVLNTRNTSDDAVLTLNTQLVCATEEARLASSRHAR